MRNEDHYPTSKTSAESDGATPTIQFGRREREYRPRGVDPHEDLALLSEAISAAADLFNVNGTLVYVNDDGTLEQITKFTLPEIVRRHVVTKRLVNRGTADEPIWKCELHPFEPDERTTILLIRQSQEKGGLGWRAPKVDAATSAPETRSAPAIFALGEFSNRQR